MFLHIKIYKLNRDVLILISTEDHLEEMESLDYPGADCSKHSRARYICVLQ